MGPGAQTSDLLPSAPHVRTQTLRHVWSTSLICQTSPRPSWPAFRQESTREELRRAGYRGRPGHPVFIPRAHWAELIGSLSGDQGANAYLRANDVAMIECSDLASGHDVDHIDRQSSAALPTNPGAPEAASLIDAGTQ